VTALQRDVMAACGRDAPFVVVGTEGVERAVDIPPSQQRLGIWGVQQHPRPEQPQHHRLVKVAWTSE
jgi:hypothetical protein